jgi:hypothetical protein
MSDEKNSSDKANNGVILQFCGAGPSSYCEAILYKKYIFLGKKRML